MLNKSVDLYLHVTLPATTPHGFDLTILYYRSPTTKNVSFLLYMSCAMVFLNFYLSTHLLIVISLHSLLGCLVLYSVIHYFLQHIFTCRPFSRLKKFTNSQIHKLPIKNSKLFYMYGALLL